MVLEQAAAVLWGDIALDPQFTAAKMMETVLEDEAAAAARSLLQDVTRAHDEEPAHDKDPAAQPGPAAATVEESSSASTSGMLEQDEESSVVAAVRGISTEPSVHQALRKSLGTGSAIERVVSGWISQPALATSDLHSILTELQRQPLENIAAAVGRRYRLRSGERRVVHRTWPP